MTEWKMNTAIIVGYYFAVSLLIAILFVTDCAGHYFIYSAQSTASWFSPFIQRGNLILLFLLGWSLALFGLLVDESLLLRLNKMLSIAMKHLTTDIKISMLVLVGATFFVFLIGHIYSNETLNNLLVKAGHEFVAVIKHILPLVVSLVSAYIFYQVFVLLGRFLQMQNQGVSIETAYREWSAGSAILMSLILLLAIGSLRIKLGSGDYQGIWRGMIKDYSIYFLIIVIFVNGLTRWVSCAPSMTSQIRWNIFFVAVVVSILCALGALILDHLFVLALEQGTVAKHLEEWQRDRMINFIHFRDYGVLVPMCVIQLLYVFYRLMRFVDFPRAT
jgi:hypothetical protein